MTRKRWILIVLFSLILSSCGEDDRNNGAKNLDDPTEKTLESISISIDKTSFLYSEDPVSIRTFGVYSDGSKSEITSNVIYVVSPADVGSVFSTPNGIVFQPNVVGSGSIEASVEGLSNTVDIQVNSYIHSIEAVQNALVLPLNANVPLLSWAWARVSGAPDINILDSLQYESLDKNVAEFLPKTDSVIINNERDTSVGHLQTKSVGTSDIKLTYDTLPPFYTSVEVVDMRLFTSYLGSNTSFPNIYDIASTNTSVFYVWGDLQTNFSKRITISQYSTTTGSWLEDINIQYPGSSYVHAPLAKIVADNNRVFVTWASYDGIYVSITNLADRVTTVELISSTPGDSVQFHEIPEIMMDNSGRTAVCWKENAILHCRLYVPGAGWLTEQVFFSSFNLNHNLRLKLAINNSGVGYFAYLADNDSGLNSLWVQKFTFQNTGILLSPRVEILPTVQAYGDFDIDINAAGDAAIVFTEDDYNNLPWGTKFYVGLNSSDGVWSVSEVAQVANPGDKTMLGIASSGEVMMAYSDTSEGLYKFMSYTSVGGWKSLNSLETLGPATPVIDYKPRFLNNAWVFPTDTLVGSYFYKFNGVDWVALPNINAMGQWGPTYNIKFFYNDAGYFSFAWYEPWAFPTADGGSRSNSLYFGYPVVRLW